MEDRERSESFMNDLKDEIFENIVLDKLETFISFLLKILIINIIHAIKQRNYFSITQLWLL